MSISSVLIIYKKSLYQLYGEERKDERFLSHLEVDGEMKRRALVAHDENQRAIEEVQRVVDLHGISSKSRYRARKSSTNEYDLVVTIGGDGTLLDASHAVQDIPMLGVNSSPSFSVGHFCCSSSDTFARVFEGVLNGSQPISRRTRLQVTVNGEPNPNPVLNEVLFSHPSPGAVTRFTIHGEDGERRYKSSGMWISTPSGSTGAIHSAGGSILPPDSEQLQYLIREPYWPPGTERLTGQGVMKGPLRFTSLARQGAVYIDGHRLKERVGYGSEVTIDVTAPPLELVVESSGAS